MGLDEIRRLKNEGGRQNKRKDINSWFLDRRKEMTGVCQCGCGKPSSKKSDAYFKHSICHILPKRHFKSVADHPLNWIELSFWGGCHTNMDDGGSDNWPKMKCWNKIVERFKVLLPLISEDERKYIPKALKHIV